MKFSTQTFVAICATILLLDDSNAAPGINPMMLSRNALHQSVRNVSFGSSSSTITSSSSYFSQSNFHDIYEDGSDDVIETEATYSNDFDNDVQLCSVSYFYSLL